MALSRTIIKLAWITRLLPWWIAFFDWITERGGKNKSNELDFTGRHVFPVGFNPQHALTHSPQRRRHAYEVAVVIGLPAPRLNLSSGQLVISDRVTECGRQGGSEIAPAEPWSLTGQGDRSPLRCHHRVCVCWCVLTEAWLPWRQHPDRGTLCVSVWVGGWVLSVAMFEYFCIFVICVHMCMFSARAMLPRGA